MRPDGLLVETQLKEIKAKISQGVNNLILNDSKNCVGEHWTTIYCVTDQDGNKIKNAYTCIRTNCKEVMLSNLKTEGTGRLKRHHVKCNNNKRIGTESIERNFEKNSSLSAAKRIKKNHKTNVNDALVAFIVNDLRPVDAAGEQGMLQLLSAFTQIGAV